jgi:hypothetical protein
MPKKGQQDHPPEQLGDHPRMEEQTSWPLDPTALSVSPWAGLYDSSWTGWR